MGKVDTIKLNLFVVLVGTQSRCIDYIRKIGTRMKETQAKKTMVHNDVTPEARQIYLRKLIDRERELN